MATAHQIRDLITQTTSGTLRHRVPREVRDEVCRYAVRRRKAGAAWARIAREIGLEEVGDAVWNIVYYDTVLGRIDIQTGKITGSENV